MKGVVRILLLGLAGIAAIASAGDQAASQPPPTPATPAPATPAPATPAPATPAPPPGPDIEDFVPSEKVSADDAVAFPVDI